ncbi:hypothetical protein QAD02_022172 [Eretmocerus hayati]|uniref:Uncharacterized protein n=1 Tax=Eretmocerus hayati TaxID=131215 RepID=A0ACC2PSA7_9HYME|nr:hypothetical protein QAD02_022172 [Eretmocerus hayati]
MAAEVRWLACLIFVLQCVYNVLTSEPHRKFEYKYSFKPPYLAQKDGSVPFWEYGGNTIASSDNVRIAPSLRSQKGAIWTKKPTDFVWWEIDLMFRISGRGRIGADGLAFWYTAAQGNANGTVFGSSDEWNGLGVFFDSFDNDNKHNNPYIMAIVNDGTKTFDHTNDGGSQILAGCLKDFRNKPFATRAKIQYYQNTLSLYFHGGMTNNDNDYEICFQKENVYLPQFGYFGISAATGGLADDHDALHFLTTSLRPLTQSATDQHIPSQEEVKFNQEFQEYQKKHEQQKEEYRKEHPEEERDRENFEEWFETDDQRELRQIFAGQSQISETLRAMSEKVDGIVARQERTLGFISQIQPGNIKAENLPAISMDSIQRKEVDVILNTQNSILNTAYEIKSFITDVHSKTNSILNNQAKGPTAQVQPLNYDYQSFIAEMRDGLNMLKQDVSQVNKRLANDNSNCPTSNCLTTTIFLLLLVVQMVVMLGYNMYRGNKEAQAKKFY